jgi:chemotaxis protein methyltransferase CheR
MIVTDDDIALFNSTLKNNSTYDFSDYSEKSLKRRITKILVDNSLDTPKLIRKLKEDKDFLEYTIKEITVNTTELFRDPSIWQLIRYRILPEFANKPALNIWHAGCSTGQEVYSMLILLYETGLFDKAKVYASDINQDVLDTAQKGVYKYRFNINYLDNFDKVMKENPFNFEEFYDIPYEKYFNIDKNRDIISMHPFLSEKPIFKKHDLVNEKNPFFIKFDIILCRNVIIYFNHKLQNKVFQFFHDNLYPEGYLILGKQESIRGNITNNFEKTNQSYIKKNNIFL